MSDVELIKRLPGQLASLAQSLFVFIGSFVALVSVSPATFVIGLGFGLLSLHFSIVVSSPMSGYRKEVQELLLRITVKIQEFALSNRLLRSHNAWGLAEKSLGTEIDGAVKAGFRFVFAFRLPLSDLVCFDAACKYWNNPICFLAGCRRNYGIFRSCCFPDVPFLFLVFCKPVCRVRFVCT